MTSLRCPLCNKIARSYRHLKRHVAIAHPLNSECPVCHKRYRNLITHFHHQAEHGCEDHAILYALYREGSNRKRNEVLERSRELLFEKLSVENSKK